MKLLHIQLVTPERQVLAQEARSVTCPTQDGQITVLPGHAPLITTLRSGELIVRTESDEHSIHIAGGFMQITAGGGTIILADAAEHFYEINVARAEVAKQLAEKSMKEQTISEEEYALAAGVLQKSFNRITIARKHAHRRTKQTSDNIFRE